MKIMEWILVILLVASFSFCGYSWGMWLGKSEGLETGRNDILENINVSLLTEKEVHIVNPNINEELLDFMKRNKDSIYMCDGANRGGLKELYKKYNRLLEVASCEGIEDYYTGDDFYWDYWDMKEDYDICYSSYFNDEGVKPVSELSKCGINYDCEDFSFAVNCLSELYNVTCNYYLTTKFDYRYNESSSHAGIYCLAEDGVWEKLN